MKKDVVRVEMDLKKIFLTPPNTRREKTTLLVPTVGIKCASHEARKLPWPPQAEELGAAVLELLDELKQNRIQYDPEAKGYWFQPGIRSWKAFQADRKSVV